MTALTIVCIIWCILGFIINASLAASYVGFDETKSSEVVSMLIITAVVSPIWPLIIFVIFLRAINKMS